MYIYLYSFIYIYIICSTDGYPRRAAPRCRLLEGKFANKLPKSITWNTKCIIFNAKFIILNAKTYRAT